MSAYQSYPTPPPAMPTHNPDTRPLPDGWVTQFDPNYNAWFYIDTRQQPPRSVWEHPLGPAPQKYAPPPGGPPGGYRGTSPAPPGYQQQPPWQPQQAPSPYYGTPQPQQQYQQQPSHGSGGFGGMLAKGGAAGGAGGLLGKLLGGHKSGGHSSGHGGFGGGYGYGNHGYPSHQPVYVQKPKKSNFGRNAALAGGAGILGGVLVADAIDDQFDQAEAYQEGFADGADFDGGDFGDF